MAVCDQFSQWKSTERLCYELWQCLEFDMRQCVYVGNPLDPDDHPMLNIMRYREYQNILPYVRDALGGE